MHISLSFLYLLVLFFLSTFWFYLLGFLPVFLGIGTSKHEDRHPYLIGAE
jgi:cadmium resistance protein CadD (predicted permease)